MCTSKCINILVFSVRKRREKVKSTVMTLLYKKAPPGHRIRCAEDNVLLAVDTESKRVLHYQRIGLDKNLRIPTVNPHTSIKYIE